MCVCEVTSAPLVTGADLELSQSVKAPSSPGVRDQPLASVGQEAPARPERKGGKLPAGLSSPLLLSVPSQQHPPTLLRLLPSRRDKGSPSTNPELMNPRNLRPVNSLFFGVLVTGMGIKAWQEGRLSRGAQFSPQKKYELGPPPPPFTLLSPLQQSLVLTRGVICLIPARLGWLPGY